MRKLAIPTLFFLLCGCGQTGPLYMPGEAPGAASASEQPAEDTASMEAATGDAGSAPAQQD